MHSVSGEHPASEGACSIRLPAECILATLSTRSRQRVRGKLPRTTGQRPVFLRISVIRRSSRQPNASIRVDRSKVVQR